MHPLAKTFSVMAMLAVASVAPAQQHLTLSLAFSTDGGKTFSSEAPVLAKPGVVKVRVTWPETRPEGEKDVYTTALSCSSSDFASANVGKQTWGEAPAWYQRPPVYYLPATAPHEFIYDLDTGARSEGVTGFRNRWDKDKNEFVDGPLPACPAMTSGKHQFSVRVSYWLKKQSPARRVEGTKAFTLTIGEASQP